MKLSTLAALGSCIVFEDYKMCEIYVRLLGEGTTVYRPIKASKINDSIFTILEENEMDVDDEIWEFLPGSTVAVEAVEIGGSVKLLASHLASTRLRG